MFTVVWTPEATDELTDLWTNADSPTRRRITAAVNGIDTSLRRDPEYEGESRQADVRVLIVAPLGVEFYVSTADRRVDITRVWRFRERP